MKYLRYSRILSGLPYSSKQTWKKTKLGNVQALLYLYCAVHKFDNEIKSQEEVDKTENTKHVPALISGTYEELENWKYYIYNNKLPLFINICININQNNTGKEYLPWITDRKYTDEEIYKLLNLTEEEIELIDKTIKNSIKILIG